MVSIRNAVGLSVAAVLAAPIAAVPAVASAAPEGQSLAAGFAAARTAAGEPVGVAIAPGGGRAGTVLGDEAGGSAWSTMKVPMAVAALQRFGRSVQADVSAAIVHSDNDAAERLWVKLGRGSQAAASVQKVLRAGGDGATVVDPVQGWGDTAWTNANASNFAAGLACVPQGQAVLALMKGVDATQQWGAASLPGAAVKGGWMPTSGDEKDKDGAYFVRQIAVVQTGRGQTAIAMSTTAKSYTAGTQALDRIGAWLRANQSKLPAGHC
ncbi:hypothetical protein P0W64_15190 [Tsukamurella sp. 8F]|uniref:hypothetical protein n=1 Tax=unclassified Tsukamurella TaxID=2633480 RepID=UPI0023B9C595|nr:MULTISPECIES: hypothetical protein [unclassified Tsukamurella]MDF0529128.1 hypothetical protein [Tsukamurella sp. 8J]MDF0588122.1 hypothetical protein [Tsukamurella sp. 8F]